MNRSEADLLLWHGAHNAWHFSSSTSTRTQSDRGPRIGLNDFSAGLQWSIVSLSVAPHRAHSSPITANSRAFQAESWRCPLVGLAGGNESTRNELLLFLLAPTDQNWLLDDDALGEHPVHNHLALRRVAFDHYIHCSTCVST